MRQQAAGRFRRLLADLRWPARGTAHPEAASQDAFLSVSKVVSNSSDGGPGIGHQRPTATGGCAAVHYLSLLLLRWLKFAWGAGMPENPLGEGVGLPSTAMLEAVFANQGFDLTPGPESRSSCQEAIWPSMRWWHQ